MLVSMEWKAGDENSRAAENPFGSHRRVAMFLLGDGSVPIRWC